MDNGLVNKSIHKQTNYSSLRNDNLNNNYKFEDNDDFFKMILKFILNEDKFRSKLLKMSIVNDSITFEQAFPKRFASERFEYIGSGSYARVYRHEVANRSKHHILNWTNLRLSFMETKTNQNEPTIIKLIDVFSENLLKNLINVNLSSSVSTYKDVYNEFRISKAISYLNDGINCKLLRYECPLFPKIYGCYMINTSKLPDYFDDYDKSNIVDYLKLLEQYKTDNEQSTTYRASRSYLKDIGKIFPEIAAIKMEDCGQSLAEVMRKYKPLEILAVAKQLLFGFAIAESAFQFEHRDLHLGNILVKKTSNNYHVFCFENKLYHMSTQGLLVKVIDTTFSRLKIKKRVFYKNLSHLFDEKDFENRIGTNNRVLHQNEAYQAMASEIHSDWSGFYPRTNLVWLIYILQKFLRIVRKCQKNYPNESIQVKSILKQYISFMFKAKDLKTFTNNILMKSNLNILVPIRHL